MKTFLAAAFLAILAWPARAQVAVDPEELAKLRAQMQERMKALAPAAVDAAAVDALATRLDRDGEDASVGISAEDGTPVGAVQGKVYTHNGQPDKRGSQKSSRVILLEKDLPPPVLAHDEKTGMDYTGALMRKVFIQMQAGTIETKTLPNGEAQVDKWDFVVSMDGKLVEVVQTRIVGKKVGPDTVDADPKRSGQRRVKPSDPEAQKRWKAVNEEFLKAGNPIEA